MTASVETRNRRTAPWIGTLLAFGLAAAVVGCDDDPSAGPAEDPEVEALRDATEAFQQHAASQSAGYTVLVTHPETGAACLEQAGQGAMGRHYLRAELVDGTVAVASPEVLMYEPLANGQLSLVGVEYVIPYSIRGADETPPTLFGREFMHNPTFQLWMLHVYAWKENPDGMFATWNPDITCDHDDAVQD